MGLLWLAATLAAIAAGSAWLAWRKRSRILRTIALAALGAAAVLLAAPRIAGQRVTPEQAFEQGFGTPVPAGLTGLAAKSDPGFGFTNLFVGFDATPAMRQWLSERIGPAPHLREDDLAVRLADGGDSPDWWNGAPAAARRGNCADRQAFELRNWRGWSRVIVAQCGFDHRFYLLFIRAD